MFLAIARFADISLGVRPDVPRVAGHHRSAQRLARGRAERGRRRDAHVLPRHRAADGRWSIPDTPAKRREYEEEVVRTFYLSNADLKETMDLLRLVLDARRISPTTATNALTIKDTPERIAAAGRVMSAIDKARPEVIIDVELLEVDRTKLQEYGLQIASPGSPGIDGSVDDRTRRRARRSPCRRCAT